MPDLIIGGNTYKNIDFVKFKQTDGKTSTFYNSERKDHRQSYASMSFASGKPMVIMTATAKSAISTAKMIKEI